MHAGRHLFTHSYSLLCLCSLSGIWRKYETGVGLPRITTLTLQTVNRFIFNEMLVQHFAVEVAVEEPRSTSDTWTEMSVEEEEAVRYAAGYVSMKLKKRYLTKNGVKAGQYVECLSHMAVDGEEASFLQYTQTWTRMVNRGGLFEISDRTYLFFKTLEVQTQRLLPGHLRKATSSKDELIDAIASEENVDMMWSMLAMDIRDEVESEELLKEICNLWVTTRGFAMTSFWLEEFKRTTKETTKKRKSLRKSLKRKSMKKIKQDK